MLLSGVNPGTPVYGDKLGSKLGDDYYFAKNRKFVVH